MKVIVTKAFGAYPKGHVIPEMPGNQARTMIARGLVAEVGSTGNVTVPGGPSPAEPSRRKRKPSAGAPDLLD